MPYCKVRRLCWGVAILLAQAVHGDPAGSACASLSASMPQRVARILEPQYGPDNDHWASSSGDFSRCSVEPSTPEDVALIFGVINQTRTPWAVKGGGHTYNQGFSSTRGLQISMTRFNNVTYDANTSTAHIGAGLVWDDVYAALNAQGVNVVGGRVPGVGVAGFTLGGGYGWHTQQYGLTIDNTVSYDLVTPTGDILQVTADSHPDLFFGLQGGGNNFGIVTGFTLKTFAQGQVYGGALIYAGDLSGITDAIVNFDANNRDPKAAILATYTFIALTTEAVVFLFYDGPTPPNGTFDEFLGIPALVNNARTQSYPEFVQSLGLIPKPVRVGAHTVPIVQYTKPIVQEIIKQTRALGLQMVTPRLGLFATLSIESFTRNLYDRSRGGAYPHSALNPWTPFQVLVAWLNPLDDTDYFAAVRASAAAIQRVAVAEGQSSANATLYGNYAMAGTPLDALFGANVPVLRGLRAKYDPGDVLALAGGWRF